MASLSGMVRTPTRKSAQIRMLRKLASFNNMDMHSPRVPHVNNFQQIFRGDALASPFRGTTKRQSAQTSPCGPQQSPCPSPHHPATTTTTTTTTGANENSSSAAALLFNSEQGSPLGKRRSTDSQCDRRAEQGACVDGVGEESRSGSTPRKRSRIKKGTLRGSIRGSIRGLKRKQKAVASLFSPRGGAPHASALGGEQECEVQAAPVKPAGLTFGQPLTQVMENQRSVFPDLTIPSLVHDAVQYVRENGRWRRECFF
jgi:hypothetical protein